MKDIIVRRESINCYVTKSRTDNISTKGIRHEGTIEAIELSKEADYVNDCCRKRKVYNLLGVIVFNCEQLLLWDHK